MTKYKLSSINKESVKAAARKVLIAADSHYYGWSSVEQENFRALLGEDARQKINKVLIGELLGIKCKLQDVEDILDDLPVTNKNLLNWARLLTEGIGNDFIVLNETLPEDKTLLDYASLYDYDYSDHLFQEQLRKKESKNYQGSKYYPFRWSPWIRLLVDDNFWYGECTSVASYLKDAIEEAGDNHIDQLIPHGFVEGKDHGKPEKQGICWDMKIDANGLEKQLDELNQRWYSYQQDMWQLIGEQAAKQEPAAYIKDEERDEDPYRHFIFNNETALKNVRWRHFLSDLEPLTADYAILRKQINQEIEKAKIFLDEQYRDIIDNFDPNVIKLRKKHKIIMTSGFLDDMGGLSE